MRPVVVPMPVREQPIGRYAIVGAVLLALVGGGSGLGAGLLAAQAIQAKAALARPITGTVPACPAAVRELQP